MILQLGTYLGSLPNVCLCGDSMLLVDINDLLHLLVTTHEDTATIVYVLGHDRQHSMHVAIDGLATSCATSLAAFVEARVSVLPCSKTMAMGPHS